MNDPAREMAAGLEAQPPGGQDVWANIWCAVLAVRWRCRVVSTSVGRARRCCCRSCR